MYIYICIEEYTYILFFWFQIWHLQRQDEYVARLEAESRRFFFRRRVLEKPQEIGTIWLFNIAMENGPFIDNQNLW